MKRLRDENQEEEGWRSIADTYNGTKTGLQAHGRLLSTFLAATIPNCFILTL
jgi:hypothetical protein